MASGNPILLQKGVPIGPGLTALTLMLCGASSALATRTTERSAALLALNKLLPPKPISFNQEVVIITEAFGFKCARAFCKEKYAPLKFTLTISSKKVSDVSAIGANFP